MSLYTQSTPQIGLQPFVYSCQLCGKVYWAGELLSSHEPRICVECQEFEEEKTSLCQWCGERVDPCDILCAECKEKIVCYAEIPGGNRATI